MGFKALFKPEDIRRDLDKMQAGFEEIMFDTFRQTGELFIAEARSKPATWIYQLATVPGNERIFYRGGKPYTRAPGSGDGFSDITADLRSSIGYAIFNKGEHIYGSFPGGGDGAEEGRSLITEVAKDYPNTMVLIVVAGMNYASYVEARGYDVLTGTADGVATPYIKKEVKKINDLLKRKK